MDKLKDFIESQRSKAAAESDAGVAYGMKRVIDDLEKQTAGATAQTGEWGSTKEAAEHYRVNEATIRRWARGGLIPNKKQGGACGRYLVFIEK